VVNVLLGQTVGCSPSIGAGRFGGSYKAPPSHATIPHIVHSPPHSGPSSVLPDKSFQLSSPHLPAIPLMATPHQRNYVWHIMHHHQGIPGTLAHCRRASFPRSHPQQMVPFQLISGKMQLSQTRMLSSRIVPVQCAQGPETRTIKRPRRVP
jgi:hypothetical protein